MDNDLLQANSAQANGRAISSSGFRLEAELRDCATNDSARLRSSGGISFACVGSKVANACSTGLLFILFELVMSPEVVVELDAKISHRSSQAPRIPMDTVV